LSLLIVLHILYHDDVSGFKIGWIILILQLPVMGGLLYLLFGRRAIIVPTSERKKSHKPKGGEADAGKVQPKA
uniref:PLD nuclease N-terminal domain-containing protein n=1 Tax=Hominenteromicrobium sp. TaxID=3073581 RepID=UPI003AB1AA19